MNDVLRTLREARPAELSPDAPVDEGVRRAELARAMAAPAGDRTREARVPRRARVRPMWGLALAGAVAAASVGVVAVTSGGDGGAPGTRGHGPQAGPDERPMDARTVLLAAAEKLDATSEPAGAYWHKVVIDSDAMMATGAGGERYSVVLSEKGEEWAPAKPGGKIIGRQQRLGVTPATKADEAAWKRAGSPSTLSLQVAIQPSGKGGYKAMKVSTGPGPVETSRTPLVDGDKVYWLGRNVSMKQLQGLPSDPKRLKKELLRWYGGHDTESSSVPMKADAWLFRVAGSLVTELPVTPKVRAGAFRMLAGLKTVRSVGKVTDVRGRTGNAIGMEEKELSGVVRHLLVIDPRTGKALAEERVLVKPSAKEPRPAGTVLGSAAVIAMEWTDSAPK
ncbi:CU044_5270 family protein [Actinomadura opuntiae]|uniref:CU044_5270 family protein n=1 Tax=Actinomadura sp. OS1-43 TaxID=604315 RepID=UPI00255B3ACF|nr:CU044_5270 family protein [Actinomadura sp. OS1-43]MDL4813488.1 CU044_5270 family protein [Actinomadura sp. OS1-43]